MTTTGTAKGLAAPLGSVSVGHLVFTRGASHLNLGVDESMEDLYRARFDGKIPDIRVEGGTVTVRYRPSLHHSEGQITLSGRVPWDIEARWGMSHVEADFTRLELRGLVISGGSSDIKVRLPHPAETVPVRIGGGASHVELMRPTGVPVRVHVGSGVSNLVIDDFRLGSAGKTDWRSPDFDQLEGRYDVEIGAGASKLTIRT